MSDKPKKLICNHANEFKQCQGCQHSVEHDLISFACYTEGECCESGTQIPICKVKCITAKEK